MTKQEYLTELDNFKADFNYCVATGNSIEARKIVIDMKKFIKDNEGVLK